MEMDILRQILVAIKELQDGQNRLEKRMDKIEKDISEIKEQQVMDYELLEATNIQVLKLTDNGYKFNNRLMKVEAVV